MKKYIIEFIGTFFLVLTIGLTGDPIAIGAVLATMVYMGGYISGANYNPAVTLAMLLQKKLSLTEGAIYVVVQLAAAIIAAAVVHAMIGSHLAVAPGSGIGFMMALLAEIIFTFALVSVVLHTAVSPKTAGNSYFGLAIGSIVTVGAVAVGHISGGAFNPAVGLGPNLYDIGMLGQNLPNLALYILGPLTGALAASLLFTLTSGNKAVAEKS